MLITLITLALAAVGLFSESSPTIRQKSFALHHKIIF